MSWSQSVVSLLLGLLLGCVGSPHVFVTQVTVSLAPPIFSHFVLFCPCPQCSSFLWSWACALFTRMSGSHVDFCPRPCFEHVPMSPIGTSDHTTLCSPCSHALIGRASTACVSSPRDWAVSIGSHMQQDRDISKDIVVFCKCSNACSPPRRAPSHPRGHGKKKKKIGRATRAVTVSRK